MIRKDCDKSIGARVTLAACLGMCCLDGLRVEAAEIRLWATAVVVTDTIKLGDLAQVSANNSEDEATLRNVVVADAPLAGGSRIIHHALIRGALAGKSINLTTVRLKGAAECEVRRPAALNAAESTSTTGGGTPQTQPQESTPGQTLQQAIETYFHLELAKYGGTAEILFDAKDNQALQLTSPPLEFQLTRDKTTPLGLCAVTVEVSENGKARQSIAIVVRSAMRRNVLVARRAINQGATLAAADVELRGMTFTRFESLGLDDEKAVLGQRARRFVPSGSLLDTDMFEAVPLVLRGQLITLISEVGGVRVVTTAKASASGIRGQTIRVRCMDDAKVELDAVVSGVGEAHAVGATPRHEDDLRPRLVLGGGS